MLLPYTLRASLNSSSSAPKQPDFRPQSRTLHARWEIPERLYYHLISKGSSPQEEPPTPSLSQPGPAPAPAAHPCGWSGGEMEEEAAGLQTFWLPIGRT